MTIEAILNAREERAKRQKLWLDETRVPLVSCTMNTAGAVKDSVLIRETISALTDDLDKAGHFTRPPSLYPKPKVNWMRKTDAPPALLDQNRLGSSRVNACISSGSVL